MPTDLQAQFSERFGSTSGLYRAPGRVNLIGEHTDYNEGYVMPVAIGLSCWVAIGSRDDRKLAIYSEDLDESAELDLATSDLHPSQNWSDYPRGVAAILQQEGYSLRGANLYIRSDVPLGAGLSSSAALEVAVGYALLRSSGYDIEPLRLALLCQRAENEFVGARCGIMDQFTACHGQAGKALMLDCRSLEYRPLAIPNHATLMVCDTKVKHELASSEYNLRRTECEEAVRLLAEVLPHVRALRDLNSRELEHHRGRLTPTLYKRVRHVVTENERVSSAAIALEQGDLSAFGSLMRASHRSLRDDYQVSCEELEAMIEITDRQRGVYGSRLTGGGFGGCTISLVNIEHGAEFQRRVVEAYHSATGLFTDIYVCQASQGVGAARLPDSNS
jgi:galactokinase